ncbi:MAG TPA: DinB family protein [Candidatus Limnocylindria bacterium]|nr:DinB family protein [Candidatus Limnocylindria bacterium]
MTGTTGVAPFFAGWRLANDAIVTAIAPLSAEQLALPVGSPTWPIWASVSHLAGTRVYWLCHVFGEPGAGTTPFTDPNLGWEDDLAHPRGADELVGALGSTFAIIERTLERWTPESLAQTARRVRPDGQVQIHTRQSVLWRRITHDAYHAGEVALTLGANGIPGTSPNGPIDLWSGLSRTAE